MPYSQLTPKVRRSIENDVQTLFRPRAFLQNLTYEQMMDLGFSHPWIKCNEQGGSQPLSPKGIAAVRRISELIRSIGEVSECSPKEISSTVLEQYSGWILRLSEPTAEEFVGSIVDALSTITKEYEFLTPLHGIDLVDQDEVELGSIRIMKPKRAFFDRVDLGGNLDPDFIFDQLNGRNLWVLGKTTGSPDVALGRFQRHVRLTTGLLGVCAALLYKGAIWRTSISTYVTPKTNNSVPIHLRWDVGGDNPSVSLGGGSKQPIPFDPSAVAYLRQTCFLDELASLVVLEPRSDVQERIVRALHWFGDAHSDKDATMRFIKLWSCAECFFSIEKEGITELVSKGMATLLAFVGYEIITKDDYSKFKSRLKKLYDLRSRALHEGEVELIENEDLEDFSNWIAWTIISMTALTRRGYRTLAQVNQQSTRLDNLVRSNIPSKNF